MGFANTFLIEGDNGLTLIDAGFPGKESAVFGAIRELGRSADQLKHLIFTHAHPDHIGSAAAIVRETGARTYMHPLDIPIAETGGPFRPWIRTGLALMGFGFVVARFGLPRYVSRDSAVPQPLLNQRIILRGISNDSA